VAYPGVATFTVPGYQNVYLPGYMGDGEAQRRLLVGFAMNEEIWALNNYITVFGADKPIAYYPRFYHADFVRVPHATSVDARWADASERPKADPGPRFVNEAYELQRYGQSMYVGDLAQEFSDIGSLIKINQDYLASKAMIRRSILTATELTTSTNFQTSTIVHFYAKYGVLANAAVTLGYSAGYFGAAGTDNISVGTINDPIIGKVVKHGVKTILKKTNGQVTPKDLMLVCNPNTADRLANTQEIRAFIAQQVDSIKYTKGEGDFKLDSFGLPSPLYGIRVLVDSTVKVTGKHDNVNEDAQTFVIPDGLFAIVSRPGSVTGMAGSSSFSTVAMFQHKKDAMKPETLPDTRSRRVEVAMTDFFTVKVVAPETAFIIQDCFDPATS
jgi:hypothetical protein